MKFLIFIFIAFISILQIHGGLVGGWSSVGDVNSENFKKIVNSATSYFSSRSNAAYHMKLIEVQEAEKQVVSGVKYRFTMRIGATECKKNVKISKADLSECKLLDCGPVEKCNVTVWSQPWLENGTRVTEMSCKREPKSC